VSLLNLSLTRGWFPPVTLSMGLLAVALLVAGRPFAATGRRQWWSRRVPLGILVGALAGGAVILIVDVLWRPFPDPLPRGVAWWTGLSAGGFVLAVLRPGRALGKALALLAVVVVVLAGMAQVNHTFGAYPTLRTALGLPFPGQVPFSQVAPSRPIW